MEYRFELKIKYIDSIIYMHYIHQLYRYVLNYYVHKRNSSIHEGNAVIIIFIHKQGKLQIMAKYI